MHTCKHTHDSAFHVFKISSKKPAAFIRKKIKEESRGKSQGKGAPHRP